MKKVLGWVKRHIIATIVIVFILSFVSFILYYMISSTTGSIYGDRCKDRNKYKVSSSTINDVKDDYKKIDEVKDVDVYTKLCTIKIIVELEKDVNLDKIKEATKKALKEFSDKELKYYDFSLFVNSDDDSSNNYPINVSKHKTSDDFAW